MKSVNNELKKDIESKISNNYVNQENPEDTIRDLARYNHHILNMNKEDNYDAILAYMTKNCNDFYEEKYFKIIYRNIASAKKFILDALVKEGILINDSRKYVIGFNDTIIDDKEDFVKVEILEIQG